MKEQKTARGRLLAVGALLIATAALVVSCGIEAPKAPSWDTTLTVPLINRTFTSGELFDKLASANITTDSLGNNIFQVMQQLDTVRLESILEVDPIADDYAKAVGSIRMAQPADLTQSINLADHMSLVLGEVPDTGMAVATEFGPADSFTEAVVDQGTLSITATNNTGFDLDSLTGELRHPVSHALIARFVAPGGLADNASHTQQFSLDEQALAADADFDVYFHTPGGPALSLADRAIDFRLQFGNEIYVRSITGAVAEFETELDQRIGLDESVEIHSARLAGGQLHFVAVNNLPLGAQLTVTVPELTTGGQPLQFTINPAAHSQQQYQLDLAGWTLIPVDDSLQARIEAQIPSSNGGYVSIDENDRFDIHFSVDAIEIAQATGIVPPTQVEWDATDVGIEVPTGFETASLELVELVITIANRSELSGDIELALNASNGKSLTVNGTIASGSTQSAAVSEIYSDQVADLLSPLPDQIRVAGITLLGDGVTTVDFSAADYITATARLTAPMAFSLTAATVDGDLNELKVDEEISDRADRLHSGHFQGTITNHLPLGATIEIHIAANPDDVLAQPQVVIGPLEFTMAPVDGNGLVTQALSSDNDIELTQEDLGVFANRTLYVAPVLVIAGTNGQVVRIRANDYLTISGTLEIQARVGGEDF
ncbi:MAG: hypothetical protein IT585_07040 [candidate division Zixibacteria bacterium]|nr:hypothetical protein [candidate division Zixibacteria bacterium]